MSSTKATRPAAEGSAHGPRGSNRLGNQIAAEAALSNAANQWGDAKRGPFWVVLYGIFSRREFWVHVIEGCPQIVYSGPDFGAALKTALAEAALHGLPVTYHFWAGA